MKKTELNLVPLSDEFIENNSGKEIKNDLKNQLLDAYLQKPEKQAFYQQGLDKMEQAGVFEFRWHWSWWAFFFGWAYLLYRKAYVAALFAFVASLVFSLIPIVGNLAYMVVMGGMAPYFVLKRYHQLSKELQGSEDEKLRAMQAFGGVNTWVIWATVIIYGFIIFAGLTVGLSGHTGMMR